MPDEPLKDSFSSDESFDDEEGTESESDVDAKLAEDDVFDVEFLKCYSALKKKDEKIYDENVRFFKDDDASSSSDEATKEDESAALTTNIAKSGPPKMTLLDLQLKAAEESGDQDDLEQVKIDLNQDVSKSYYEKELEEIKKAIEEVGEDIDGSDDEFLVVKKSEGTDSKPKNKINSLLDKIVDEDEEELKHLKEVWADPENLSKEDRYLRDYILNKRYLPSNVNVDDDNDGKKGFFSSNLDDLSDVEGHEEEDSGERKPPARHSDEKDFDKLARIPRNSTKTIRDMVEKQEKREKRAKKLAKEKKKKKAVVDADCEDVIGDMPTKFHYRETEPNDFGLTAEELLMATDEELNQWVNLHECVAYKSKEEELAQRKKYDSLRGNIELKKKILKSVYGKSQEEEGAQIEASVTKAKRKRRRSSAGDTMTTSDPATDIAAPQNLESDRKEKKRKKRKRGLNHKKFAKVGVAPDRLLAYGLSKTKLKKSKLL